MHKLTLENNLLCFVLRVLQTEDDLRTGMYKVLEHLRDHEDAWPFHDAVEEEYAPNYYAVIRRPMHISRVSMVHFIRDNLFMLHPVNPFFSFYLSLLTLERMWLEMDGVE